MVQCLLGLGFLSTPIAHKVWDGCTYFVVALCVFLFSTFIDHTITVAIIRY